jgi:GNAT superfamily N-acetyltransferase
LQIERVRNSKELAAFIDVPRIIYEQEAHYAAPLVLEQTSLLHPKKAPFFKHGYAAFWTAKRGGAVVGRVSAQIDFLAKRQREEGIGFFGCVDAINDGDVLRQLLATAERWLQSEGCTRAQGPFTLSINGQSGLLTSGQAHAPMIGMPWHPKYLGGQLEGCGYSAIQTLHAYELKSDASSLGELKLRATTDSLQVRHMNLGRIDQEAEVCRSLFNEAWKDNWGFIELARSDMIAMAKELKPILFEDCTFVAELDGRPIAFMLVLPNLFDVMKNVGPSPTLFGFSKLLWRTWRRQYETCRADFCIRHPQNKTLSGQQN